MRLTTKRGARRLRVWAVAAACCAAANLCGVIDADENSRRQAREAELQGLLDKIDRELVGQVEADLRAYMDARMNLRVGPIVPGDDRYIHTSDDGRGVRVTRKYGCDTTQAKPFFDAYDLVGDDRYLRVALDLADFYLRFQTANTYHYDQPETWPQGVNPSEMHGKGSLVGAKHILELYRKDGRQGLQEYFTDVAELSPEAYLTARIRAARWVLEEDVLAAVRRRPLANCDPRWRLGYGENSDNPEAAVAWRFIENVRVAEGRFTRRQLAPGARPHFGGVGRHAYKVGNWFDLPPLR